MMVKAKTTASILKPVGFGTHCDTFVAPGDAVKVEAGQLVQTDAFTAAMEDDHVPALQGLHDAVPFDDDHVPALQFIQSVDPVMDHVPGLQ